MQFLHKSGLKFCVNSFKGLYIHLRATESIFKRFYGGGIELHSVLMPSIMDAKEGCINRWYKKSGDNFKSGERLCEVSLNEVTIAMESSCDGVMVQIIADKNQIVLADQPIATYVLSKKDYMSYLDALRVDSSDAAMLEDVDELEKEKHRQPDVALMMRVIKHLIQSGHINEDSSFAKKLLALTRKGNVEIKAAFEASYEGKHYDEDSFDINFFLSNAKDIVEEYQ